MYQRLGEIFIMDKTKAQITKIAREANKLAVRVLKQNGIGTSEFDLIHVVRKHDGISQNEISKILGTDKAMVARQVKSLIKRGYITKTMNPSDKRSCLIYKTDKSDELKISKRHVENVYYEYLLSELSEEEQNIFCSILEKVYLRSKEESKSNFINVLKLIEE